MVVAVDEAGEQSQAGYVNNRAVRRQSHGASGTDRLDAASAIDQNRGIGQRGSTGAVDQVSADEGQHISLVLCQRWRS